MQLKQQLKKINNMKYYWNPETVKNYKDSNLSSEELYNEVKHFVGMDCQLEDGETEEQLIQDLIKKIQE